MARNRLVRLIGVPMDLGAGRRGVDMGPSAIRIAGVDRALRRLGYEVGDAGDVAVPAPETHDAGDPTARYLSPIYHVCDRLRREAEACYRAAGIDHATEDEYRQRLVEASAVVGTIEGAERVGGSGTQSLVRGSGSIEADYLNGEVVLLGRLHGVATPVNEALCQVANEMARAGRAPGSIPAAAI